MAEMLLCLSPIGLAIIVIPLWFDSKPYEISDDERRQIALGKRVRRG